MSQVVPLLAQTIVELKKRLKDNPSAPLAEKAAQLFGPYAAKHEDRILLFDNRTEEMVQPQLVVRNGVVIESDRSYQIDSRTNMVDNYTRGTPVDPPDEDIIEIEEAQDDPDVAMKHLVESFIRLTDEHRWNDAQQDWKKARDMIDNFQRNNKHELHAKWKGVMKAEKAKVATKCMVAVSNAILARNHFRTGDYETARAKLATARRWLPKDDQKYPCVHGAKLQVRKAETRINPTNETSTNETSPGQLSTKLKTVTDARQHVHALLGSGNATADLRKDIETAKTHLIRAENAHREAVQLSGEDDKNLVQAAERDLDYMKSLIGSTDPPEPVRNATDSHVGQGSSGAKSVQDILKEVERISGNLLHYQEQASDLVSEEKDPEAIDRIERAAKKQRERAKDLASSASGGNPEDTQAVEAIHSAMRRIDGYMDQIGLSRDAASETSPLVPDPDTSPRPEHTPPPNGWTFGMRQHRETTAPASQSPRRSMTTPFGMSSPPPPTEYTPRPPGSPQQLQRKPQDKKTVDALRRKAALIKSNAGIMGQIDNEDLKNALQSKNVDDIPDEELLKHKSVIGKLYRFMRNISFGYTI
jgi:hypothetical protein